MRLFGFTHGRILIKLDPGYKINLVQKPSAPRMIFLTAFKIPKGSSL